MGGLGGSVYDDFPVMPTRFSKPDEQIIKEVMFSNNRQNYCVSYVDMMNSTKTAAMLGESEIGLYYSTFINSMVTIVTNFEAKVIKTAGDCVISYFPRTTNSEDLVAFKNVLECGMTMMAAHKPMNAKLHTQGLPSMNFRISCDYGTVEVARSFTSQNDDLFGSTMNLCAKINSKAPPNGLIIGEKLYRIVQSLDDYFFERLGEYHDGSSDYELYSVTSKEKRIILDPFSRKSYYVSKR